MLYEVITLKVQLTEKAKAFIIEKGFDPAAGARPLRRTIQRLVEDPLSDELLRGTFTEGDTIKIDHEEGKGELSFEKAPARRRKSTADESADAAVSK